MYVIGRLLATCRLVVVLITVTFFVLRLVPGGPAVAVLGDMATPEAIAAFNSRWGLDRPLWSQYLSFMFNLFRGDLGVSYTSEVPVSELMADALPHSLLLMASATLVSLVIGLPLGIYSALRAGSARDGISRIFSLIGLSIPDFYLGILLILLFSLHLGWLPMSGAGQWNDPVSIGVRLIMPTLTLGIASAALVARTTRSAMLEVLNQAYVATARSKGLAERIVIVKHALRNALSLVVTVVGLNMGITLGNTLIVETVFTRPGLGKLLTGSVLSRDFATIQSSVAVFAGIIALINLLTDLTYAIINPRVRYR